jgi:hypothetical protein
MRWQPPGLKLLGMSLRQRTEASDSSCQRLAFDRINVDGPQPAHAQHIHPERATDTVAIERADQIVDAVDVNAVQFDYDIAGL